MDGGAPTREARERERAAAESRDMEARRVAIMNEHSKRIAQSRELLHFERSQPRLVDQVDLLNGTPNWSGNRFDRIVVAAAAQRDFCRRNHIGDRVDARVKAAIRAAAYDAPESA